MHIFFNLLSDGPVKLQRIFAAYAERMMTLADTLDDRRKRFAQVL